MRRIQYLLTEQEKSQADARSTAEYVARLEKSLLRQHDELQKVRGRRQRQPRQAKVQQRRLQSHDANRYRRNQRPAFVPHKRTSVLLRTEGWTCRRSRHSLSVTQ